MELFKYTQRLSYAMVFIMLALASCAVDPDGSNQNGSGQDKPKNVSELALTPLPGDSLGWFIAYAPDASIIAVNAYTIGPKRNDSVQMLNPYIAIYDAKSGALLRKLPGEHWPMQINRQGDKLLVQVHRGGFVVYDIRSGNRLFTLNDRIMGFMHDGERLIAQRLHATDFLTLGYDIFSATTGELLKSNELPGKQMWQLTVTPDDRYVMLKEDNCGEGYLYLWDLETGVKSSSYNLTVRSNANASSEDGTIVALTGWDGGNTFEFFESQTGKHLSTVNRAEDNWRTIEISNDRETYAQIEQLSPTSFEINLRRITDGSLIRTLGTVDQYPVKLSFSADGTTLAAGLEHGVIIYKVR